MTDLSRSPRERAQAALTTYAEEIGLTWSDLASIFEQRVADAIADAEEQTEREVRAEVSSRLQQLEQEKATLQARLAVAEHHKVLSLLGKSSWQEVVEDKLRIELAETQVALAETRDALHQLQEKYDAFTTPVCHQCSGRGWITRSESHDLGNGLGAGGSWNEVCPRCQVVAPVNEQEP